MSKGMPMKDAMKQWEDETGQKIKDAKVVKMICKFPFIDRMDASLSQLEACEQLSLSTNKIDKISNLNGLKYLRILSIGRNSIKSLTGIEAVGDTLVELWCSYNSIDKAKGLMALKKLKLLHMSFNKFSEMGEVGKFSSIPTLEDLVMIGNPIEEEKSEAGTWVNDVVKRIPTLKKLDGSVLAAVE